MLTETFIEEKSIILMEGKLTNNYKWLWTPAVRDNLKGRPWGGELIGVKANLSYSNFWQDQRRCCSGIDVDIHGNI